MSSQEQQQMLELTDKFQVTGYSHKPFYRLSSQEANALGAKKQKDLIFFKGVLIRGTHPNTKKAIMDMDWIRRKKHLWPGRPITIGHPNFKAKGFSFSGKSDEESIKYMLEFQEDYSVGRIMKVDDNSSDPNLLDFYGYVDQPDLVKGIDSGEVKLPRYGSPYVWAMGEITPECFDQQGNFLVKDHMPIHWSFVDYPAMGPSIEIKSACSGEEAACVERMIANGDIAPASPNYDVKSLGCPCDAIKKIQETTDKSFYIKDPLEFKMSQNETDTKGQQAMTDEAKKFLETGSKDGSMPESVNKPEGTAPNPGEQVDRDKQSKQDSNKEEESQEEKSKLETLIEEERVKATRSAEKKYSKELAEKDATIKKLEKTIADLNFKEIEAVINESFPDDLYGNTEDNKKKATETREFYTTLAKEHGLSREKIEKIVGTSHQVKELKVSIGSASSSRKGQANSAVISETDAIKEYYLAPNSSKQEEITTPEQKAAKDKAVREFLGLK